MQMHVHLRDGALFSVRAFYVTGDVEKFWGIRDFSPVIYGN